MDRLRHQLEALASVPDFTVASAALVENWLKEGVAFEAVDPVMRFMESHPHIEYGMPGELVHFVERFYGHGYETVLIESVKRRPTPTTVWMLNRVLNGTKEPKARRTLVSLLQSVPNHPLADDRSIQLADQFLDS